MLFLGLLDFAIKLAECGAQAINLRLIVGKITGYDQ